MKLNTLLIDETFHLKLWLRLLALLDQVSATVNTFCLNQPSLVLFARTLDDLFECLNDLLAQKARVAVDVLLLKYSKHLGDVWDEIETFVIDFTVGLNLYAQIVL